MAISELVHDPISFLLFEFRVNGTDREILIAHAVGQEIDSFLGVAEYDSLSDGQRIVQIHQSVELVLVLVHQNEELPDR